MIRKLLFIIIFLAVMVAAVPAIDGFMFKRYFENYLQLINQKIPNKAGITIELSSYQMGYTNSTAKIIVSMKDDAANKSKYSFSVLPTKYEIDMTVSHGPIVNRDGKWKIAYADVNYQMKVPYFEDTLLTANTLFGLFTNKVTTNYSLGKMSIPNLFTWDGFKGEIITSMNGKDKIISTFNLGKLDSDAASSMKFNLSPMQFYNETMLDRADNTMTGKSNTYSDGFSFDSGSDMKVSMKKILFDSSDSIKNNLYQYSSTLHIDAFTLPLSQSIEFKNFITENKFSNFKVSLSDDNHHLSSLLKESITPASFIESKASFDTAYGHTDISASLTDLAFPDKAKADSDSSKDYPTKYKVSVNGVIPQELLAILLSDYFSLKMKMSSFAMLMLTDKDTMPNGTDSSNAPDAKAIIAQLVEKGILVAKDSNYTLSLSMTPEKVVLNGTTVDHPEELLSSFSNSTSSAAQKTCVSYMTNVYGQMVCSEYSSAKADTTSTAAEPAPATETTTEPVIATPPPATIPEPVAPTPEPAPVKPEPAPTPEPAPIAKPATAEPTANYGCYWQQTSGGVSTWIFIKELDSKEACFKMDTCNGGQGASKGGCFKWATSADGNPQPW